MPNLIQKLSETVIFLFEKGTRLPIGTAFIVGYPIPNKLNSYIPFIVTAKHVVNDSQKIIARFTGKDLPQPVELDYDLEVLRKNGDVWEHPDKGVDIILFRTPHFDFTDFLTFPLGLIASKDTIISEDIKVTDRIVFPCLLTNFMGTSRNYPVFRDGTIAMMPEEKIPLEYQVGETTIKTNQNLILADATSMPGASGSPVFLYPGPRLLGNALIPGGQPWLLGVMHGFYPASPREVFEMDVPTNTKVPVFLENSGIAIIFPGWKILEIFENEHLKQRIESLTSDE